jgi:hypothetical protein
MEQRKKLQSANPKRGNAKADMQGVTVDGMIVDKNLEEGKMEVGYVRSDGRVGSKFEMYNKLEGLATPSQPKTSGFSMKKNLFPMADQSQKKLISTVSPKSGEKRSPSGGKRTIQIEPSQVALN